MPKSTPEESLPLIAAGVQVVVRDEEWLVSSVQQTPIDGLMVSCLGQSVLVRDQEATFFTSLDRIEPLRPEETVFVADDSPRFQKSRLHLEAVLRKTPVPATEHGLSVSQHQLLDELQFQRRAVRKALTGLRPRLLIGDGVGLGKTLEVGMILSELIRRGRGERILVVTPRHILKQFQHELWTRFAIPLVRLDSEGIQRVRRKIPGNRNPFTYYKRVIISIDTLKQTGRYRHHLEGIHWDAVVIDECHNLVNRGTLNNRLARVLAPRADALLLTSATPHNGDPKSFAELIRLLDPAAIVDPDKIQRGEIEHLYVRRHKKHEEVAPELGDDWADRLRPKAILVEPSEPEAALFNELANTWLYPTSGKSPVTGKGRSLFPWTLLKAALSSHKALAETVEQRRKTLVSQADPEAGLDPKQQTEDEALVALGELCDRIQDGEASKLLKFVEQLREIGVGPRSKARVVVFSERIATLDWLHQVLPDLLGLNAEKHLRVLHGRLSDIRQMDVIEDFGLERSGVKLLLTGDMASEGVNLHRECHHLIHFDLSWSLITVEQRNGRIDRYGQTEAPDIRALLVAPDHPKLTGDLRVLDRLIEREHYVHEAFGDAGVLFDLHSPDLEEDQIMKGLRDGLGANEIIPDEPANEDSFNLLALIAGTTGTDDVKLHEPPTLFGSQHDFVEEALRVAFTDPDLELDIQRETGDPTFLSFVPPPDLVRRFSALPQSYLVEQGVASRLNVTADPEIANNKLEEARAATDSSWPTVSYLSPLHPLLEWLTDKVLVGMERNQAPAIIADVKKPVFCVQGMYSNKKGRPQLVEWLAVTPSEETPVLDLFDVLRSAGVRPGMMNPGTIPDLGPLAAQLHDAIRIARAELENRRIEHDAALEERLAEPSERLEQWNQGRMRLERRRDNQPRTRRLAEERKQIKSQVEKDIEDLRTKGDPLVRVLAVLVPGDS